MSDRRSFITVLGSSLGGALAGGLSPTALFGRGALQVVAEPTAFWAQPDGGRNLVRFSAVGLDAPAGRLRVYDAARRLIGTAGMLRVGDALRGELWIPLDRAATVTSELEAPGVRGPYRTSHRLAPSAKWTIVWLTVAAPEDLAAALAGLSPVNHAVQGAIWREAGVIANPLAAPWRLHQLDHESFLRGGDGGGRISHAAGIETASVALIDDVAGFPSTTPIALRGAGIRYVVRRNGVAPYAWWSGPDGSRVLALTLPEGADPDRLGFAEPIDTMAARVAAHLERLPVERPVTFVAQTAVHDRLPHMAVAVQEWNRRFAYPRILLGGTDDLETIADDLANAATAIELPVFAIPALAPAGMAARLADERETAMRNRADAVLRPLAQHLAGSQNGNDPGRRLAANVDTRIDGILVTNPSPFRRTDVAVLDDGRRQLVTDVPAFGYAFVPVDAVAGERSEIDAATARLEGPGGTVRIDSTTGAIRSLRDRSGREWVAGRGYNAVDGAVLVAAERVEYAGIATTLILRRYATAFGEFTSHVTARHAERWFDIENRFAQVPSREFRVGFDSAFRPRTVQWEVPVGRQETDVEELSLTHLRWIALGGDGRLLLLRGLDTPMADVRSDARIEFAGGTGVTRYRVLATGEGTDVVSCARFGWNAEPFHVLPVAGNTGGTAPRFGAALVLDQTDAALIGLDTTSDGTAMTALLQNLTGDSRFLTVGFGLLRWTRAHRVDFLGREIEAATDVPDGFGVQVPGWGVTAVRVTGVSPSDGR